MQNYSEWRSEVVLFSRMSKEMLTMARCMLLPALQGFDFDFFGLMSAGEGCLANGCVLNAKQSCVHIKIVGDRRPLISESRIFSRYNGGDSAHRLAAVDGLRHSH